MSQFRNKNINWIYLDIDIVVLSRPRDIGEAFSKHFQSVYCSSFSGTFGSVNQSTEILSLFPVSNSDVQNAVKRMRSTNSVRLNGVPSFVTKCCSESFVLVLKFNFNLILSQNNFPDLWKQAVIVPVFKKRRTSSAGNYKPIAILQIFTKLWIYHTGPCFPLFKI